MCAGQDPAVPLQQPECTAPPSAASAEAEGGPRIVCQLLDAFAAHGGPEWLTLVQIADHLVGADLATWGQWEGRHNRLLMVGRTFQSALRRAGVRISVGHLSAAIDPKRPAVYKLADIQRAGQSAEPRRR